MSKKPRFLYADIETSLMEVYTFYIGHKVSISHDQIKVPKKIVCIGYKWSDEKKVHQLVWNPSKETNSNQSEMLETFNDIAREADYIVGHNFQDFDVREIRTELALRGGTPWCETPIIDTLKDYRRVFRFASNKQDAVSKQLGLGGKGDICLKDWIDLNSPDKKVSSAALTRMCKYNKRDVLMLEDMHKRLDLYVPPAAAKLRLKATRTGSGTLEICPQCHDRKAPLIKYGRYKYRRQDAVSGPDGTYSEAQKWLCQGCFKVTVGA